MPERSEANIIEELLKSDKLKIIKPNECGLLYDEKRERIITICNKDGNLEMNEKKLRPSRKVSKKP